LYSICGCSIWEFTCSLQYNKKINLRIPLAKSKFKHLHKDLFDHVALVAYVAEVLVLSGVFRHVVVESPRGAEDAFALGAWHQRSTMALLMISQLFQTVDRFAADGAFEFSVHRGLVLVELCRREEAVVAEQASKLTCFGMQGLVILHVAELLSTEVALVPHLV
jgi:hypothetical protein